MDDRTWKTLWCDRRNRAHHKSVAALAAFVLVWIATSYAATNEPTDPFQSPGWRAFLAATGLIQVLIGYIYITGISSMNKKIDKLFDKTDALNNSKMDKDEHDRICPK